MNHKSPRRIVAQPYDFSVQDLVDKIQNGDIDLKPDYQRNYVWIANDDKENKRSRLIESLLLNIPIPVIYFAEQAETLKYEVIDGQQRLKTFQDYLNDAFPLTKLEIRDDANGKLYSQLPQKDRDEIRKRSIRAIVVLNESDEQIKYEVFERLNLGSVELTPQEIRNNTLRGSFNDLLKELANDTVFRSSIALRLKSDQNNMAHEELVLRFFAYYETGFKRVDQLNYFLTEFMRANKDLSKTHIERLRKLFHETMGKINKYLGEKAFSIYQAKNGKWNPTSNRLLYEAEMLAFALVDEKEIVVTPTKFQAKLKRLMENNSEFMKALDKSSGARMEARVNSVKNLLISND